MPWGCRCQVSVVHSGVAKTPDTRYAAAVGGGHIAYQAMGEGPVDLLVTRPTVFPIDMMWEEPRLVRFLDRLSSFSRHFWFDPRGTGASDWIPHEEGRLLESVVDDMVAVLDDAECEQAAILGLGNPVGLLFAAAHPDRTQALVIADTTARLRKAEDYPEGLAQDRIELRIGEARKPGRFAGGEQLAPSLAGDITFRRWSERAERLTCPPDDRYWRVLGTFDLDLRHVLGSIRVPTLVLNHVEHRGADQTRYVAHHIEGARTIEVPGADFLPFASDSLVLMDAVEEFLTGRLPPVQVDRVLATVLFTDIVNSTGQAASMGDRRWGELLSSHDLLVRSEVERFRGKTVKSTGDGVLATFDGPARAIRCACALRDGVRPLGLEIRAGLHCGEIELHEDDVAGISVHIGQRVASLAGPSEVLVSRTVADLLAGSEIAFADHGEHELKGVPGTWRLFEVLD